MKKVGLFIDTWYPKVDGVIKELYQEDYGLTAPSKVRLNATDHQPVSDPKEAARIVNGYVVPADEESYALAIINILADTDGYERVSDCAFSKRTSPVTSRRNLSNKTPLIGVTPLWDAERQSVWMLPDYLDGIHAAGGIPIVLPLEMTEEEADRIVATCDGFLFTGGQDVGSCPERDKLETLLLQKALQADKPIMGICRGLQFINVFLGGTLWQDLPSQHPSDITHRQGKPYNAPTHEVALKDELQTLLGKDRLQVNTLHHQAIKDLGQGLVPLAVAPDGLIEAIRMTEKRFVWAVQWHPEYLFRTDTDSLALLSCFVRHCCRLSV